LIVNPHSFARRINATVRGLDGPPPVGGAVKASAA
jgi:hypothetical protein